MVLNTPSAQLSISSPRKISRQRVLSASDRKSTLSFLAHRIDGLARPVQFEMISSERIHMLMEKRRCETERGVVNGLSFCTELIHHTPDVERIPDDDVIVEHG